jgi:serine/threonine protein kinase
MTLEGTLLGGKYRIVRQIGAGGMGRVYEALHEQTERTVAVKVLSPEAAQQPDTRVRFDREARAAGRIGHDNICEVVDVGFGENDVPYLVMPLLRGSALGAVIRQQQQLSLRRCIDVTAQILAALAAAHAAGVVHRDLKPDNVFLVRMGDREDFVKVLDFGISKMIGEHRPDATLTQTGTILGTPYYMSPEQARGLRDLDARVDVYAVGAILYQMLTGKPPFDGDSYNQLLSAILLDDFPRPSLLRADVPPALEELILRATEKDREKRYRDAGEMRQALLAAVTGTSLRPSDLNVSTVAMASSETIPSAPPGPGTPLPSSGWAATPTPQLRASAPTPGASTGPRAPASSADEPQGREGVAATLSASRAGQVVLAETASRSRRSGPFTWAAAAIVVVLAVVGAIYVVGRLERGPDAPPSTTAVVRTEAQTRPSSSPVLPPVAAQPDVTPPPLEAASAAADTVPEAAVAAPAPDVVDTADAVPATVKLTFHGLPDGARIRVDDVEREGPVVELPREDRSVKLEVRLRGYEPWTKDVSAAEDGEVQVELQRLADRPPARDGGEPRDGGEAGSMPVFGEGP